MRISSLLALLAGTLHAQPAFDLLLKGGQVLDAKNNLNAVRDVAIKDGKIAALAPHIDPARALKTVDVSGLYVTPGLIDIHTHVYTYTGAKGSANDRAVMPDGFTFRTGVTRVADAGSSGWRNFDDFKKRIILPSRTRVFAFLNIVGAGARAKLEQDLSDMDGKATGETALKHKDLVVGIKSSHFMGPEWKPSSRPCWPVRWRTFR